MSEGQREPRPEARVSWGVRPGGTRWASIQLHLGEMPADTIEASEAHVDVDQDGNLIGVTLAWKGGEEGR